MLSPRQRRSERAKRNQSMVDMNLVSLIDVFTILIFFLLSSATEVEVLPPSGAVKLPASNSETTPRDTLVVVVSPTEILVQGRKVANVSDVMALQGDVIEPLKAELEAQGAKRVVLKENEAQSKAVTIMGDKDIPYNLLRKIMATSARANFTDVSFAVRHQEKAS
jgi:biopolymer transport protein ExbD